MKIFQIEIGKDLPYDECNKLVKYVNKSFKGKGVDLIVYSRDGIPSIKSIDEEEIILTYNGVNMTAKEIVDLIEKDL